MNTYRTRHWNVLGGVALAVALIAFARPRLCNISERVRETRDVYTLPPSSFLPALSLGFRSAMADLIWAHVLVTQGLRMGEQRPFEHCDKFLDAINELDPKFREPYRLADSLLTYQPNDTRKERNVRAARGIVERGLKEFPNDMQLWLNYGEFLAYIAPTILSDEAEGKRWRVEGARALVQAGDLGGAKSEYDLWHAVSGVGILSKEGEQEAMIRFLERVYAATEDEQLRSYAEARIEALNQGKHESRAVAVTREFDRVWRTEMPFVSRTTLRILGPRVPVWRCAGDTGVNVAQCERTWSGWAKTSVPAQ